MLTFSLLCLAFGIWFSIIIMPPAIQDLRETLSIVYDHKLENVYRDAFYIVFFVATTLFAIMLFWRCISDRQQTQMEIYKILLESYLHAQ